MAVESENPVVLVVPHIFPLFFGFRIWQLPGKMKPQGVPDNNCKQFGYLLTINSGGVGTDFTSCT